MFVTVMWLDLRGKVESTFLGLPMLMFSESINWERKTICASGLDGKNKENSNRVQASLSAACSTMKWTALCHHTVLLSGWGCSVGIHEIEKPLTKPFGTMSQNNYFCFQVVSVRHFATLIRKMHSIHVSLHTPFLFGSPLFMPLFLYYMGTSCSDLHYFHNINSLFYFLSIYMIVKDLFFF